MPSRTSPTNSALRRPLTALDYVRRAGIIIASDSAEYNRIGEFDPIDATSNPSLIYAAVCKAEYSHLVDDAVEYVVSKAEGFDVEQRTQLALLKLLVLIGVHILSIVPGRVSASVDPRLGNSIPKILLQARTIIDLFAEHSIPSSRVLIKIPGTPEGITAAHILEHPPSDGVEPILTNMTLIFSRSQALACAQAGVSVISPFVGRVKDWWDVNPSPSSRTMFSSPPPLPGLSLVSSIKRAYTLYGYAGRTQIMAAGFRKPEEVLAMSAGLGRPEEAFDVSLPSLSSGDVGVKGWKKGGFEAADLVTIPPELLSGLRDWTIPKTSPASTQRSLDVGEDENTEPIYFVSLPTFGFSTASIEDLKPWTTLLYLNTLQQVHSERIVLDKVPEGLGKFSADAEKLETILRGKVRQLIEV